MGRLRILSGGCALLAGAVLVGSGVGCQNWKSWDYSEKKLGRPGQYEGPADPPEVSVAEVNDRQMRHVPVTVEGMFNQDHPTAVVTGVEQRTDGSGRMLYQVSYIEDGIAGQALYRPTGADLRNPPASVIIVDEKDDYRPKATPVSPTTKPAESADLRDPA